MAHRHLDQMAPIRVGVLGAGEVSQVIHLPTLSLLDDLYTIVGICDVSEQAVAHTQKKFHIPFGCQDSAELCTRSDIDLILIATADEYHAVHAVLAADHGKHVFIEKPMTLTRAEAKKVEDARRRNNVHISIGYMRRYTPVWSAFLEELEQAGPISFARVFDYSGPNSTFVSQSATRSRPFSDIAQNALEEKKTLSGDIATTALGDSKGKDTRLVKIFRLLGSLGSHDISCMRHAFGGVPKQCLSAFASLDGDFVGASFLYEQKSKTGPPFLVSYETGIHPIGTFDAYIEVYCQDRILKIKYDTPYVKGLPIMLTVRENTGKDGRGYQERHIRATFLDAYSAEFIRLSKALKGNAVVSQQQSTMRNGWAESSEMCSPVDSVHDLDVFDMIMEHLK